MLKYVCFQLAATSLTFHRTSRRGAFPSAFPPTFPNPLLNGNFTAGVDIYIQNAMCPHVGGLRKSSSRSTDEERENGKYSPEWAPSYPQSVPSTTYYFSIKGQPKFLGLFWFSCPYFKYQLCKWTYSFS